MIVHINSIYARMFLLLPPTWGSMQVVRIGGDTRTYVRLSWRKV